MSKKHNASPLFKRLNVVTPAFPLVTIPAHLHKRETTPITKRERLLLWWLTYRLPVDQQLDHAAIALAAKETRLEVPQIEAVRESNPIRWERVLYKRQLRLSYFREHGSVPDGVCPGWPIGANTSLLEARMKRETGHAKNCRKQIKKLIQLIADAEQAYRLV